MRRTLFDAPPGARLADVTVLRRPLREDLQSGEAGGSYQAGYTSLVTPSSGARVFAVVGLGGTQYKVSPGDIINAEHVPGAEVGSKYVLSEVLAVGSASATVLGRPTVPGASVRCAVEEQALDAKVIVYKKRRRKRYQRTAGHRRMVTRLRVEEVSCDVDGWVAATWPPAEGSQGGAGGGAAKDGAGSGDKSG